MTRQSKPPLLLSQLLDWPESNKLLMVAVMLTVFFLQFFLYAMVVTVFDKNFNYVTPEGAFTVRTLSIIFLVVSVTLTYLQYIIVRLKNHWIMRLNKYVFTCIAAVMLLTVAAFLDFANLTMGVFISSVPIFAFVLFNRRIAFFSSFIAITGVLVIGYAKAQNILPMNLFYQKILFSDPSLTLIDLASELYFTTPIFILMILGFSKTLSYWRTRAQDVYSLSRLDSLTSLLNRRSIQRIFEHQLESCRLANQPLSIIIVDIDHFKSINDRYGHPVGDQVLITVAEVLGNCVRRHDCIGRYGGEEFLIVLENTSAADATNIAERCKQILCEQIITSPAGQEFSVSACFGVFTKTPIRENTEVYIKQADSNLYRAKNNGRNCVWAS